MFCVVGDLLAEGVVTKLTDDLCCGGKDMNRAPSWVRFGDGAQFRRALTKSQP